MFDFNNLRTEYIAEMEKLPYGDAVLVLPGGALQGEVQSRHMVQCVGLDTLAMGIVNQSTQLQGFDRITRQAQELLVEHLLLEHKSELKYFGPLLGKKGLVKELTGLFTELRRCNLHSGDELADIFANWLEESGKQGYALAPAPVTKNADVVMLFGAYIEWITNPAHKVYDVEGLFMLATEMLESGEAERPYKKIFLSDFLALNPVEEDFINALQVDSRPAWGGIEKTEITVPEGIKVQLDIYASHREELEGAFREIAAKIKGGMEPGDFILAVKNLNGFSGVKHIADKFGVPVTLPRMDKLNQHPLTAELLQHLGEGNSFEDYFRNARQYLNDLHLEDKLGAKYQGGQVDLLEVQNVCAARNKLLECLNTLEHTVGLCSFLTGKISQQTFTNYFRDAIRNVSYVTMSGDSDGVLLTDAIKALGYSRKQLYLLGVNVGEWPSPLQENWIYTDLERKSMSSDMGILLPTAMDHYLNDNRTFSYLLTTATESIHCSWTVAENMDLSVYAEKLKKASQVEPTDHRGYRAADQVVLSRPQAELATVAGVDALRRTETKYNGIIHPVVPEKNELRMSASQLLQYVRCPFAYMVQRIWKQKDEEVGRDEIAPYEIGDLVHGVICAFYQQLTKEYGKCQGLVKLIDPGVPEGKELLKLLRTLFDAKKIDLLAKKDDMPILRKQVENGFQFLETWLNMELTEQTANPEMRPVAVEQNFDNLEPVQGLSSKVIFNGIIDRVDGFYLTVPDENQRPQQVLKGYYISDYKTGKAPQGKDNVQLPLYTLAWNKKVIEEQKGLQLPVAGSYISLGENGKRGSYVPKGIGAMNKAFKNFEQTPDAFLCKSEDYLQDFVTNTLRPNLQSLLAGSFATPDKPTGCDYCGFKSICRQKIAAGEVSDNE